MEAVGIGSSTRRSISRTADRREAAARDCSQALCRQRGRPAPGSADGEAMGCGGGWDLGCISLNVTPMRHDGTVEPDAPGVFLAILIVASGDENGAVVRRRRLSLVRESPPRCLARGPRVPLIAA